MARPTKLNLDYFPLDVDVFDDIKIRKLMRYHGGGQAFSIYAYLLCLIYKNGYYFTLDEEVYFLISEKVMCSEEYAKEVITYCVSIGLFDKNLLEKYNILTSQSIQIRFKNVSARRSSEIAKIYCLLSSDVITENSKNDEKTTVNAAKTRVNVTETRVNVTETRVNAAKIPQSKVKESKGNIGGTNVPLSSPSSTTEKVVINSLAFLDFFNRTLQEHDSQIPTITQMTPRRIQALTARAKKYGKEALRTAVINAATAPFLNGASEKPFVANFDWIFRPNNFPKVLEGNYNHEVSNFNPSNYGTSQKLTAQQRIEKSLKQGTEHFADMLSRNEASLHEDVPTKVW